MRAIGKEITIYDPSTLAWKDLMKISYPPVYKEDTQLDMLSMNMLKVFRNEALCSTPCQSQVIRIIFNLETNLVIKN